MIVNQPFEDFAYEWLFGGYGLEAFNTFTEYADDLTGVEDVERAIETLLDDNEDQEVIWQPPGQVVAYRTFVHTLDRQTVHALATRWWQERMD